MHWLNRWWTDIVERRAEDARLQREIEGRTSAFLNDPEFQLQERVHHEDTPNL